MKKGAQGGRLVRHLLLSTPLRAEGHLKGGSWACEARALPSVMSVAGLTSVCVGGQGEVQQFRVFVKAGVKLGNQLQGHKMRGSLSEVQNGRFSGALLALALVSFPCPCWPSYS